MHPPTDDKLFEGKEGQQGSGTPTPDPKPLDLTPQLEAAAERAFGGVFTGIAQTLNQINTRLTSLEKPEDTGRPGSGSGEPGSDLYEDPDKFVKDRAREAAAEAIGPLFQTLAEDKYTAMESKIKGEVDGQFGDGTFDEMFVDDVRKVVGSLPVGMRSSENHFRSAVNGIKGMKWDQLQEKQGKVAAAVEERRNQFRPLDGGRARPAKGSLSEDESTYLADLARHGIDFSREDYIQARDAEKTASGFPVEKQEAS